MGTRWSGQESVRQGQSIVERDGKCISLLCFLNPIRKIEQELILVSAVGKSWKGQLSGRSSDGPKISLPHVATCLSLPSPSLRPPNWPHAAMSDKCNHQSNYDAKRRRRKVEVGERSNRRRLGGRRRRYEWGVSLKGCALIRGREGASGQTDRATWKPAVHTPAASEMGSISTLRTSQWNKTAQEKSTAADKENTVHVK